MTSNPTLTTKQGMVARGTAWKVFAVVGSIAIALSLLRLPATLESTLLIGVSAATTLAMFFGLKIFRPRPLAAWILIAIGQFFNCLGNCFFTHTYYLDHPDISPEISAGFYLIGMLGFIGGSFVLFSHLRRLIRRDTVAQSLIVAIGFPLLVWMKLIYPNLSRNLALTEWVSIIIFPASILAMGFIASMFLMTSLGDTWWYRFLFGVLLFYAAGLYFYGKLVSQMSLGGVWSNPELVILTDMSYSTAYVLLGIVFLHPSISALSNPLPPKTSIISRLDLVILGIAFCVAPADFLIQSIPGGSIDAVFVISGMILVFVLIEWRLAQLVRVLESQNHQLSHQRTQLHHQAHHDSLTGIYNRAFFEEELTRLERSREFPASVVMADMDDLKVVNDTQGHAAGDELLRRAASVLQSAFRAADVLARVGGDEFAILLPNTDAAMAKQTVTRVKSKLAEHNAKYPGLPIQVSLGVATAEKDKLMEALKVADQQMYANKSARQASANHSPAA